MPVSQPPGYPTCRLAYRKLICCSGVHLSCSVPSGSNFSSRTSSPKIFRPIETSKRYEPSKQTEQAIRTEQVIQASDTTASDNTIDRRQQEVPNKIDNTITRLYRPYRSKQRKTRVFWGFCSSFISNNGLITLSIHTLVNISVLNTNKPSILSAGGFLVLIQGILQRAKFDGSILTLGNQ